MTVKGRMIVAVLAWLVLLSYSLSFAASLQTPCPDYFEYVRDQKTKEIRGRVNVPSVPKNTSLHMKLTLSLATALPTRYVGRLELAHSREKSVQAVSEGRPLTYRVVFPLRRPIPRLTGIYFNGRELCSGPRAVGQVVTSIMLEHTLYPPGVPRRTKVGEKPGQTPSRMEMPEINERTQSADDDDEGTETTIIGGTGFPYQNSCGRVQFVGPIKLIYNGEDIVPGQWPWLVAIFVSSNPFRYHCAGNLITQRHVLTAAHCFRNKTGAVIPPNGFLLALGRYRLRDWFEAGSINSEVIQYYAFPDYQFNDSADSDLGIMVMRESVTFTPTIQPICLWSGPIELDPIVNMRGTVVGWGRDEYGYPYTQEPRMIKVPIVSQKACLDSNLAFQKYTSDRTFCAGDRNGAGPCNGDSGAGLILFNETTKRYQLRGVVSLSLSDEYEKNCNLYEFLVYADAAKHIDWILDRISEE